MVQNLENAPAALAQLTYDSYVGSAKVRVQNGSRLAPGMWIELASSNYPGCQKRSCRARILSVLGNEVEFSAMLSTLIPAAASGDYVFEAPPTDAELIERRLAKIEKMFEGVCTEHDDCKASLLAHACKESQRQSEEKPK